MCRIWLGYASLYEKFLFLGAGGILLSIVILFFIVEGPNEHRNISKAELNFILSNQETTLSKRVSYSLLFFLLYKTSMRIFLSVCKNWCCLKKANEFFQ